MNICYQLHASLTTYPHPATLTFCAASISFSAPQSGDPCRYISATPDILKHIKYSCKSITLYVHYTANHINMPDFILFSYSQVFYPYFTISY